MDLCSSFFELSCCSCTCTCFSLKFLQVVDNFLFLILSTVMARLHKNVANSSFSLQFLKYDKLALLKIASDHESFGGVYISVRHFSAYIKTILLVFGLLNFSEHR